RLLCRFPTRDSAQCYCTTSVTVVVWFKLPDTPFTVIVYVPLGVLLTPCCPLLVVSCKFEEAVPVPGVTDAGEKLHVAFVGNPVQLRLIGLGKFPPSAVAVTLYEAVEPAFTVALAGDALIE